MECFISFNDAKPDEGEKVLLFRSADFEHALGVYRSGFVYNEKGQKILYGFDFWCRLPPNPVTEANTESYIDTLHRLYPTMDLSFVIENNKKPRKILRRKDNVTGVTE